MRHSSLTKRQTFRDCDTNIVGERVCAFLRKRYPARTVDNVVADLAPWDIKAATVSKMLERQTAPGTMLWLALIWAYGPDFLSSAHPAPLGWLDEARRKQRQAEYEAARAALETTYEDCK